MSQLHPELGVLLDSLQKKFHLKSNLASDPLEFSHRYEDSSDQECVALISALLAYGNVKQIRASVSSALAIIEKLDLSPTEFVRKLEDPQFVSQANRAFSKWFHRFNRGEDLVFLLRLLERSWAEHGTLGAHFGSKMKSDDVHVGAALSALISDWKCWAKELGKPRESFFYFLTSPEDGSCCKRWCMFLRWMGRRDELDLGLWAEKGYLKASQLVIPLDTHTGRISQYLGLTARKSLNWKAAIEVTENLKNFDPEDPVRFDFAISRLGILDLCQRRYRAEICDQCQLVTACKFAQRKKRRAS